MGNEWTFPFLVLAHFLCACFLITRIFHADFIISHSWIPVRFRSPRNWWPSNDVLWTVSFWRVCLCSMFLLIWDASELVHGAGIIFVTLSSHVLKIIRLPYCNKLLALMPKNVSNCNTQFRYHQNSSDLKRHFLKTFITWKSEFCNIKLPLWHSFVPSFIKYGLMANVIHHYITMFKL